MRPGAHSTGHNKQWPRFVAYLQAMHVAKIPSTPVCVAWRKSRRTPSDPRENHRSTHNPHTQTPAARALHPVGPRLSLSHPRSHAATHTRKEGETRSQPSQAKPPLLSSRRFTLRQIDPAMAKPRAPSAAAAAAAAAAAKAPAAAPPKTVHSALVTYASMLSLLSLCPPFVILLWYTMVHADGSVVRTYEHLREHGVLEGLKAIWPMPTMVAWKIIFGFGLFEAALQLLLPGKRFEGPVSPSGNVPVYKANGLQAYAVTLITYLSLWWFGIFNPAIVYDHLGEIYSALVFGSFVFCIFLYVKGHIAPSSSDSGSSGNVIIDFYWGMELYPRIGKHFDIKVFTNCRFGMMSWAVLAVTYCIKQYEMNGRVADSMLVNTALMLIYVTKFFWWESGYWCTMDIAHDRAGFYICWGCLVWVPSIYTSPGMYLVNHPVNLGPQLALSILLAGILCIYINYDCDRQRQEFRRTNGKCSIWGKAPSKIVASYQTTNGETKSSLLLTSGWWGLSRHFHYVPEILSAFFWTVPALFDHFLPYFYVIFLTILLFDRAKRDDDRCSSKYGKYWKMYCNKVPYRVIPGIY